ncbi:metal ABC transporter solute-binding protein, Zn/Mn family [Pelagicoccus albus]|uniref:Zinc ABC transporter substrate-binding protein n=1 Tax=Pelagicoccus albus TaxID=415222 RepID=A0A7X1B8W7_9BACT|nr:zinc ABC transporter substrate-binding protein [Pelagicoccus albus]MBC2607826.1 zinc ABC transporter substrate-binding protein [Pelagicoccus albus]
MNHAVAKTIFLSLLLSFPAISLLLAEAAPLKVVVSILPQQAIVEGVGGDNVEVITMVPPGIHPNTFEPSPSKMASIANADLYVAIDLPHERNWIPQILEIQPDLPLLHTRDFVQTRTISGHVHHDHDSHDDHADEEMVDPHIWLAAPQLRDTALAIRDKLISMDPGRAADYRTNADAWLKKLEAVHAAATAKLDPFRGRAFLVFHPAWGYISDSYGLRQIAIEQEGMPPGPRMIAKAIDTARAEGLLTIFVQKHFSQKEARTIAIEIGGSVTQIDPFHEDPIENLQSITDALASSFK